MVVWSRPWDGGWLESMAWYRWYFAVYFTDRQDPTGPDLEVDSRSGQILARRSLKAFKTWTYQGRSGTFSVSHVHKMGFPGHGDCHGNSESCLAVRLDSETWLALGMSNRNPMIFPCFLLTCHHFTMLYLFKWSVWIWGIPNFETKP